MECRGQSASAMVAVMVMVLVATVGLVLDGGEWAATSRRVASVCASSARAAMDSSAPDRVVGRQWERSAIDEAVARVGHHGMRARARVVDGTLRVDCETTISPRLLGAFGVGPVTVTYTARARMVAA